MFRGVLVVPDAVREGGGGLMTPEDGPRGNST
jgi:hypothetical protein